MAVHDLLYDPGTNGLIIASPLDLLTTELNTLANGSAATSSVGGSSGVFTQANTGNGVYAEIEFKSGGAFTPAAPNVLLGWFLRSLDGGSTFETVVATPSTTVYALSRVPDFYIPLSVAAYASGNLAFGSGPVILPSVSFKVLLQSLAGATLPASGNKITIGPFAPTVNF